MPGIMSVPAPPQSSDIVLTPSDSGARIYVPAMGWRNTPQFVFCLYWAGFGGVFWLLFTMAGWWKPRLSGSSQGVAVMCPFCLPWPFMFRSAIKTATMETNIYFEEGEMVIERVGWHLDKRERWKTGEILAVKIADSGMEINDTPVPALEIQFREWKKLQLFAGRPEGELKWLVEVLNGEIHHRGGGD